MSYCDCEDVGSSPIYHHLNILSKVINKKAEMLLGGFCYNKMWRKYRIKLIITLNFN